MYFSGLVDVSVGFLVVEAVGERIIKNFMIRSIKFSQMRVAVFNTIQESGGKEKLQGNVQQERWH